MSLQPVITATGIDNDWLLSREAELISNGVLSLLYAIPRREWSDPATAEMKASAYQERLIWARSKYRDNQSHARRTVAYGGI